MLDQAVACLSELNKSHIDEVRNFKKPPSGVVLTMECACIMLRNTLKMKVVMKMDEGGREKKEDYWATALKYLLKQPKLLLETLKSYDKNNISDILASIGRVAVVCWSVVELELARLPMTGSHLHPFKPCSWCNSSPTEPIEQCRSAFENQNDWR